MHMKKLLFAIISFAFTFANAQNEPVIIIEEKKKEESQSVKTFYSQKLINAKTVEVLRKGILEFNVSHSFGDIGGDVGGASTFFGLDNATDVKIGFQAGLSDKVNMVLARVRGAGSVRQQLELGLKWQLLAQTMDNQNPVSLTIYANNVVAMQKALNTPGFENSYEKFGDRHSQIIQLMLARKAGKASFQISPTYLHTNYVIPGDDKNIFALGGAVRLPLSKKIVLLADYFHPFRSQSRKDLFASQGIKFYDPFGVGLEIVTEGHVFNINFTNATELLENRFLRHTVTNWGDGEFRWAFTISRSFILFRSKK
jgi:Membrane bound beta barrel domain (DUF5777)